MNEKVNRRNVFRKLLVDSVSDVCCLLNQTSLEGSAPAAKGPTLNCTQAGALLHSRKTGKKGFSLRSDTKKPLNTADAAPIYDEALSSHNHNKDSI